MHEGAPVNKNEIASAVCTERGVEVVNDCADLSYLSLDEAMSFLKALLSTNEFVLHGTNSEEVYKCLEARQGHCVVKESGRKVAVYATDGSIEALSIAVLNRKYLASIMPGYISARSSYEDVITFKFPKVIYDLFVSRDPNVFSDGYVYVMDKSKFVNAADAGGGEWHSESDQEPILACKISGAIGRDIYFVGTDHDNVFEDEFK